jgi:hypothetical protein
MALSTVGVISNCGDDRVDRRGQSLVLGLCIDLFMGFVLGPILRRVDLSVRREIMRRLTPRTLFLMPTVSIISGTSGWFLAVKLGYPALQWPAYG